MSGCTYVVADVRRALAAIPDGAVDIVITSPPFLALRSYLPADHPDKHLEIGAEPDPAAFVATLLGLTAEWRRVLAPHGTLAVELGDTYAGSGMSGQRYDEWSGEGGYGGRGRDKQGAGWPLPKSLALIPEAYRLGLAYGLNPLTGESSPAGRWRVRNTVTWCRPNPPVGALGDKFRPSTSDLVIACTARDRWFDLDAVREWNPSSMRNKYPGGVFPGERTGATKQPDTGSRNDDGQPLASGPHPAGAPPLDHWIIPPGGYTGSHYAVFPPELCRIPIEAMCPRRVCRTCGEPSRREVTASGDYTVNDTQGGPKGAPTTGAGRNGDPARYGTTNNTTTGWTTCDCPGTDGIRLDGYHTGPGWRPGRVLDPFGGSGTTGLVASGLSRDAILIDFDARNLDLARERIGMWLTEASVDDLPGLLDPDVARKAAS